jgi:hypothetical protein
MKARILLVGEDDALLSKPETPCKVPISPERNLEYVPRAIRSISSFIFFTDRLQSL